MVAIAIQLATTRANARRSTRHRTLQGRHRDQTASPH